MPPKDNSRALAVMARVPELGKVKTRLEPFLGAEKTKELYLCFLSDIFANLKKLNSVDVFVFYTPENLTDEFVELIPYGIPLAPQKGSDLGERMLNAASHLFGATYESVVIIGSDSPDLPVSYIEEAFKSVEGGKDIAIGPASDGGYYLVALSDPKKAPFAGVNWGTETVLEETLAVMDSEGTKYSLLSEWYDIDEKNDLAFLKNNLEAPKSSDFVSKLIL